MSLTEFFDVPEAEPEDPLRTDLIDMIKARYHATPRHLQVELGPSDIAHPCMRKMAYGMVQAPKCNPDSDPLPSIVGTAAHKWMESAAKHANNEQWKKFLLECNQIPDKQTRMFALDTFKPRWLTETRVNVAPGLSGSCDLYDTQTDTVIDHKFPGSNQFSKFVKDPGIVYKTQVHLYAKGFQNSGLSPKRVAIAFLPRNGQLRNMHLWQEDYDPAIAEHALKRREATMAMLNDFNVEADPDRFHWIPATPVDCQWCGQWSPKPKSGYECAGGE